MSNRLAHEASPYLQQHAENPVDWYPWGEEAFARARAEDKPIHLSVGYFACHWCHVMAHECFENEDIARELNAKFINIKVDRQERPDVDDLYQRLLQMMGQSGGWPLTVFLTPEQEPFFGGTYFAPEDRQGRPGFPRLLQGIEHAWKDRRDEVKENCRQFLMGMRRLDDELFTGTAASKSNVATEAAKAFARSTDPAVGGLGGAPKFPNASCHDLMLRVYARTRDKGIFEALARTLDGMAAGGIYDHLGGGFARYSVDARWEVPHFEKMLYDNGQLVKLYADAYRATGRESWRRVFEGTIEYVLRDLTHPQGGFYASEDADSEGEEGKFYVWNLDELRSVLGDDDARLAAHAYGVRPGGNFEHGQSVLQRIVPLDDADTVRLDGIRDRLLAVRARRIRPGRDENILAGWNGLMIQGLCAAYQATRNDRYLAAARGAADFLADKLARPGGGLVRTWRDGAATVPGFLDDYSFLANGIFDLYECSFEERDRSWALSLVDSILERFWDERLYFTPRETAALVHRPIAPFDNAWPSGISQSAFALQRAQELSGQARYGERAQAIFDQYAPAMVRNAFGFAHLLAAREFRDAGPVSIQFAGTVAQAKDLIVQAQRSYLPGRVLALSAHLPSGEGRGLVDGMAAAYVCREQTCLPPIVAPEALASALSSSPLPRDAWERS
jgi:uncharacterized protein YyaL (SSP411 family)